VTLRPRSLRQVLAAGAARVRRERGLGDEAAAELLRSYGLTGWQGGTVSQVEAGVRPLAVEELLLLCTAYGVSVLELAGLAGPGALAGADRLAWLADGAGPGQRVAEPAVDSAGTAADQVEVTAGARLPASAVRALLGDDGEALRALPPEALDVPATRDAPAGVPSPPDEMVDAARRFGVRGPAEVGRALAGIGDAERNAARRLGVSPERLVLAAVGRWGRSLTDERDIRIERRRAATDPDRHIMLRGLVTRELLAELEQELRPSPAAEPG